MISFLRLVVHNYNEAVENFKDPMSDEWPLMGTPGPMLCIISAYLIFVLKAGPKMMEKRPAFQLKTVIMFYNASQIFLSIWLVSNVMDIDFQHLFSSGGCNFKDRSLMGPELSPQTMLSKAAWWYLFSKIIELLDTVFFVLRKKQNQVTFLHVYHHTIMVLGTWGYLKWLPGEQGVFIGILNSFVHIIMYSYYFLAGLGPQFKKYLWWKKYLTWLQLIQFVIMIVYLIITLVMDCPLPKALTYFYVINLIIFIYLFNDFYQKAYNKKTN